MAFVLCFYRSLLAAIMCMHFQYFDTQYIAVHLYFNCGYYRECRICMWRLLNPQHIIRLTGKTTNGVLYKPECTANKYDVKVLSEVCTDEKQERAYVSRHIPESSKHSVLYLLSPVVPYTRQYACPTEWDGSITRTGIAILVARQYTRDL